MANWNRLVTSSTAGNVTLNIDYAITNVKRSGNTVTFNYGIRFIMADYWTYNSIAAFCPAGGTLYYAFGSAGGTYHTDSGVYYYANTTGNTTTSEVVPFSYSKTVDVNDTSLTFSVGFGWDGYTPTQQGTANITVTFEKGFTNPTWTKYTINSSPAIAYANMPYSYNIDLACNYGSSTSDNLLYWEAVSDNRFINMVSTTETSIAAGVRSYNFSNSQIDTYKVRGVIRYNNGSTQYMSNSTAYPLTVSFLNPTITSVSNVLNATNFYRTSTVSATASATVNSNSTAPSAYIYFSSPDAPGNGAGTGFYNIANYSVATTNSFSGITKSYTHPGDKPGTFYAHLSLRGNNASNTWTEFATVGQVSYTMREFVAPTMTRTITYNKHNIYVGQTKLPVKTVVTATNKSQYDTLTPTCSILPLKNSIVIPNVSSAHNWSIGAYNTTLIVPACASGDTISFRDQMTYKNALNVDAYSNIDSSGYIVRPIPQPNASEIAVTISNNEIKKQITVGVTGNFDSDFVGQYTLYLENSGGTTVYAQTSGTVGYDNYVEHTFIYNGSISETYRVRMVSNFALVDEVDVKGNTMTTYSNIIRVIGGTKIYIKYGDDAYDKLLPIDDDECPKPRLAFKYGDTIKYIPLFTDTPPTDTRQLWVRQGGTDYYTLLNTRFGNLYPSNDLYPEG